MVAQAQDTHTPAIPAPGGTPRALTPQERGRLGGQATLARHGTEFFYVIRNRPATRPHVALLMEDERNASGDKR